MFLFFKKRRKCLLVEFMVVQIGASMEIAFMGAKRGEGQMGDASFVTSVINCLVLFGVSGGERKKIATVSLLLACVCVLASFFCCFPLCFW